MCIALPLRVAAVFFALVLVASTSAHAAGVQSMSVEEARTAAASGTLVLVDIRTPGEWRQSGVPDLAVPLDMRQGGFIENLLALREDNPDAKIGLICATGGRSRHLANWLAQKGVTGVVDVPAGMHTRDGWLARQLPVRQPDAAMRPVASP